jgi:hypothetical protein
MHRATGELQRGQPSQALARKMALSFFLKRMLPMKGVCSETAGATCAAGSSARRSHHVTACTCRNRSSARAPRPETTASRAEQIVGKEKVRLLCF